MLSRAVAVADSTYLMHFTHCSNTCSSQPTTLADLAIVLKQHFLLSFSSQIYGKQDQMLMAGIELRQHRLSSSHHCGATSKYTLKQLFWPAALHQVPCCSNYHTWCKLQTMHLPCNCCNFIDLLTPPQHTLLLHISWHAAAPCSKEHWQQHHDASQ